MAGDATVWLSITGAKPAGPLTATANMPAFRPLCAVRIATSATATTQASARRIDNVLLYDRATVFFTRASTDN